MHANAVRLPGRDSHLSFLGFSRHPFPVVPDASQYHLTPRLAALAHEVLFAVQQRVGFIVLTGEVGLGKSTFCRYILAALAQEEVSTSLVFNSYLQEDDLIQQILLDFGLSAGGDSVRERIDRLNEFFLSERLQGRNCVIFIDDAQNLTARSLEYIRLLSNLETAREKLVQVLLVGQPELDATLSAHELRQLQSRIALRRHFGPFTFEELEDYVRAKLARSTREPKPTISGAALKRLARVTGGNPRAVNLLLDRALLAMIARRRHQIGTGEIAAAERDLRPYTRHTAGGPRWPWLVLGGSLLAALPWLVPEERRAQTPTLISSGRVERAPAPVETPASRPAEAAPRSPAASALPTAVATYLREAGASAFEARLAALLQATSPGLANSFDALADGRRLAVLPLAALAEPASQTVVSFTDVAGRQWALCVWAPSLPLVALEFGATSPEVAALQARLRDLGYYWAAVDGRVGPVTLRAVAELQRRALLQPSGQPGNDTLFALDHPEMLAGLLTRIAAPGAVEFRQP